MNDILLFTLSLIGLLALYWVFMGQSKWNNLLRENPKIEVVNTKKNVKPKIKKS